MGRFNSAHSEISWGHGLIHRSLQGEITWQAPSNLALVKYWGKKGHQLPANPSLSLTLRESVSVLEANFHFDPAIDGGDLTSLWKFQFQGDDTCSSAFGKKMFKHLETMAKYYPFLSRTRLALKSHNTFPHSAGIASSASASLSAALLVEGLAALLRGENVQLAVTDKLFLRRASFLARLGSGSATRSAFPVGALWGAIGEGRCNVDSSDEWGIGVEQELPYLKTLEDLILVVDQNKKKVSSREGHELMECHPYRRERFLRASDRLHSLWATLASGKTADDFHSMGLLIEAEALDLHALMMSSTPPVVLMCADTLAIILSLWQWRAEYSPALSEGSGPSRGRI